MTRGPRTDAGGEALRSVRELLRQWVEEWPTELSLGYDAATDNKKDLTTVSKRSGWSYWSP